MNTKLFEIRDSATFIPVIAIQLQPSSEEERYLLARAGYGSSVEAQEEYILLGYLGGGDNPMKCDPMAWSSRSRTMSVAHQYIIKYWDGLDSGTVIDVMCILGESKEPKRSERFDDMPVGGQEVVF